MSSEKNVRLNQRISNPEVRLIGKEGENLGVVAINEALKIAEDADLDLVEVVPNAKPPVCKVMNYGKFKFEQSKKAQQAKKKQKQIQIKEVKFRPVTEENDYQVKLSNLKRFLSDGDKAKITIRFRGRELAHKDIGMEKAQRIESDLIEVGEIEQEPQFEGRQIVMVIAPKK
ncbi:MAG: translation initiation factor IF-3 [Pseudomonadota bacterium]|nr:translation initiation factor IF-3 [Gammaproteobacteria bacterium]MEC7885718.1 translation initiation factor IF-3 [Pseudomonadota bacterium]